MNSPIVYQIGIGFSRTSSYCHSSHSNKFTLKQLISLAKLIFDIYFYNYLNKIIVCYFLMTKCEEFQLI